MVAIIHVRSQVAPPPSWPWPFLHIGHRGLPEHAPENSLRGFSLATSLGAEMVETDLRLSRDGALVLAHDDAIDLSGRSHLRVSRTPMGDLRRLTPGGEPLATLDEALDLRHHGAPLTFNLNVKVAGTAPALLAALRRAGRRSGILLTGHAARTFAAVRTAEPWVQAALTRNNRPANAPGRALAAAHQRGRELLGHALVTTARLAGVNALTLEHTLATRESVAICHRAGLRVLVWTVDHLPTMRHLRDIGVDGITTNRVDVLLALHHGETEIARDTLRASVSP